MINARKRVEGQFESTGFSSVRIDLANIRKLEARAS
jgi:hypothetical protein